MGWDDPRKNKCRRKIEAPSLLHEASENVHIYIYINMFTHNIGAVGQISLSLKFLPLLTATAQIHYAHLRSPRPGHSIRHQLQCLKGMTWTAQASHTQQRLRYCAIKGEECN